MGSSVVSGQAARHPHARLAEGPVRGPGAGSAIGPVASDRCQVEGSPGVASL